MYDPCLLGFTQAEDLKLPSTNSYMARAPKYMARAQKISNLTVYCSFITAII